MSSRPFDPGTDGWSFFNKGEANPFTWDLFRDTYLGVNPTQDCAVPNLDCAFFELFKICAKNGNCGGMSLLGLALYKYGGYMGFCSPANHYAGDDNGPQRSDLRKAINILQARQFNVNGIRNFLDMCDSGTLNNAVIAFARVKELLGKGDYPVLSIATDITGGSAHTVIPYAFEDSTGWPKYLYIWDSNIPYNSYPGHYYSDACKMTIRGPTDWTYAPPDMPNGVPKFYGGINGWCFVVPMSLIVRKSRHPMSPGMLINALMTLFITGSGASIGQISNEQGRRLYSMDSSQHASFGDMEMDPTRRLPGCGRWRWYGSSGAKEALPEVYFMRYSQRTSSKLHISLNGVQYRAVYGGAGNSIIVEAKSEEQGHESLSLFAIGTPFQSLELIPSSAERNIMLRQMRVGADTRAWRAFEMRNVQAVKGSTIAMRVTGDFSSVIISGKESEIPFDLRIEQTIRNRVIRRDERGIVTAPGKMIRLKPDDWAELKEATIEEKEITFTRDRTI